ncbi:MAG: MerR family transcriptional regulator, partial [Erysipelotrichaceae bacterium]|nr:MerR family transcriptional regulator [Erysipelotrichaceae bacterium]
MKTNEVEKLTGLSKQTLLFYEREKLIEPSRDDNGYRNYNEKDLQLLTMIRFLRSMEISIDDIRLIMNHQLSFQDCLESQQIHMNQKLTDLQQVKSTIDFYKDKNIPLIPELVELNKVVDKTLLGYQKTSPYISIGRPLTRSYALRKVIMWVIIAIILGVVSYFAGDSMVIGGIVAIVVFMIEIGAYACGLGEMNMLSTSNNASQFIEFKENGICFIDNENKIKYLFDTLLNNSKLTEIPYGDIIKVKIVTKQRYMKIPGSNLSTNMDTYDYYFDFKDGTYYAL